MRLVIPAIIGLTAAQPLHGSLLRRKTTINVDPWTEENGVDRLDGDEEKTFLRFLENESNMSMGMPDEPPHATEKPDTTEPHLNQQCIDEYVAVSEHTSIVDALEATDAVASTQFLGCDDVCTIDYASVEELYKTACAEADGQFITFDYTIDCTGVHIDLSNFPLCIGQSCDTSLFETAFFVVVEELLQEDEATKSCVIVDLLKGLRNVPAGALKGLVEAQAPKFLKM